MIQPATMPHEPHASAVLFAVVALLLAASALLSHASQRLRLPVGPAHRLTYDATAPPHLS